MNRFLLTLLCLLLFGPLLALRDAPAPAAQDQADPQTPDPAATNAEDDPGEWIVDPGKITDLPLLEKMEIPSMTALLTETPVDWIILNVDRVVVSEPITPRPNTILQQEEKLKELRSQQLSRDERRRAAQIYERRMLERVHGTLVGEGLLPQFRVETRFVREIWHHEDLMLKRADLLMAEGKLQEAYELLFALKLQYPDANNPWPGLNEAYHRLLIATSEKSLEDGQLEDALARLEELHDREPNYERVTELIGETIDRLISTAVSAEDYRRGRYFLFRLERRLPEHAVVSKWKTELQRLMEDHLRQAREATQQQDFLLAAELTRTATRIWPRSTDLRDLHRVAQTRYQIIRSGVLHLADAPHGFPLQTDSDRRGAALRDRPLFDIYSYDGAPRYRTSWFERWEPTELGRNVELTMQTTRPYWEPVPGLNAVQLRDALLRQIAPGGPAFDERLAGYVRGVRVLSPYEIELEFSRVPLRPAALLHRPALTVDRNGAAAPTTLFRETDREDDSARYVRGIPEPDDVRTYHVAEIVERRYADEQELLRALLRSEVDFLPDVPLWARADLQENTDWVFRKYALPTVHLLQFHPESLPAQNQELRRALLYALDRERLLEDVVLAGAAPGDGRVTTAPFPQRSYAFSLRARDARPDLRVALSLSLAARKQVDGAFPKLRMICDPDPAAQRAAAEMIRTWQRIGIDVELVPDADASSGDWAIAYRKVIMAEPLTELWPFLTMQRTARVEDLQILPSWLRQQLIDVDLTTNWDDAVRLLQIIHENLWGEAHLIPLWEVDRWMVFHKTLRGVPEQPVNAYDAVETWVRDPWIDLTNP